MILSDITLKGILTVSVIRSSSWSYRITLTPTDKLRLKHFIGHETAYFNALVNGLAGPLRTMPGTFKDMTGQWEEVFALAATHSINPMNEKVLPKPFQAYAELLASADAKKSLLLDVAATKASLSYVVRRAMAVEVLRHAREQSASYNSVSEGEQVYRYALETLSALQPGQKRHVQLPKGSYTQAKGEREDELVLTIPYFSEPIKVAVPPVHWNMLIVREDQDGGITLELSKESAQYLVKRTDASGLTRRKKKRGDHRGAYSMPVSG